MSIQSSMKRRVISILDTDTLQTAAKLFLQYHVGTLPVTTGEGKLVGILKLHGLLTLILPAFTRLMGDFDFVGDFGAMESIRPSPEIMSKQVSEVMEAPVFVDASSGLSRAFSFLHHHNLTDLPVVDSDHHLVGIASRVDIGTAILRNWEIDDKELT
jgi:CBS-domain-containing membrane protein